MPWRQGKKAIDAQLARLGLPGRAMAVPDAPGAFQVRYELTGRPLVQCADPPTRITPTTWTAA